MIIGDAPSMINARNEEYLSGGPGKLLAQELEKLGITDYYYTGVVKCVLPDKGKAGPTHLRACMGYLQEEIKAQNPTHILVLGATAVKAVCKESSLTACVGKIIERDGITYLPCYSPAYVLRDPSKEPEFLRTLRKFRDLIQGKKAISATIPIRIIDRSNLSEFRSQFKEEKSITMDLETSGLDHYNPDSYINCIGMWFPKAETAWVLPVKKAPTLPANWPTELVQWMSKQNVPVINQNYKFDSLWIWSKMQAQFYNSDDTMLAHYNLDENSPHGLKENARSHLGAPDYDLTASEKKGNTEARKLFTYCAWDVYYTYQLHRLFQRELMKDSETRTIYQHLTMPVSRMYEVIEREGHFINLDRMEKTRAKLFHQMNEYEAELNKMLGREINWNSPRQVGQALYGDLKLVPRVFTDTKAPSTAEAALAELEHPVVDLLQNYRGVQKQLSTYIDGWEKFMVGSYLFLGTKIHGTVTGRFSSRMHTVPRDGTIRNLVEAPEGWTFVQADLSQAELRVVAEVSGDPELIRCYQEGIDVHWRTTISILRMGANPNDLKIARCTVQTICERDSLPMPDTIGEILDFMEKVGHDACIEVNKYWKEKRKQSKGVNFGYVYGMGAAKFCEYAKVKYDWDVSLSESESIRIGFFGTYVGLTPWHERQRNLVAIDGYVRSLSGRKRRLPGIWSPDKGVRAEAERQAINSPIQGFIGDLKVMGMLDIFEQIQVPTRGEKLRIKGEVHDSVLMWVKTEHLDEILPQIKHCMEHPTWLDRFGIKLKVPIVADLEVGTWGAGKTWKGEKYGSH